MSFDAKRRKELRMMLEAHRLELRDQIKELRTGIAARNTEKRDIGDSLDGAADTAQTNTDTILVDSKHTTIRMIDNALYRLRVGTYGVCVVCHDDIEEKRLKAENFAARCIPCQEKLERRQSSPQQFAR